MSRRAVWIAVFGGATVGVVAAECWASWDADPATVPWTELIVRHVPGEVTLAVLGAVVAWLPVHFYVRYRRKQRGQ